MVVTFTKKSLTDTLISNEKEVCPGCGYVALCDFRDCWESLPRKDH